MWRNSYTEIDTDSLPKFRDYTHLVTHTTLGRTPLDEWSGRRRDPYL